ncbi:tyrosine-type recombinase/integrase [Sporosarcina sp. ACRSM]|uniref:tyrosine-type recombinase/integrase n=1 Tax=Sporosarcina sp. ACRSM TaxID=2918216 RepID=UPI001EF52B9B|nr:tyrosine-type recombinase/integrase [Sporosarcina sp. ACRSM]MCG7337170.1 tyrosine-type recombinase/integrase [Sporosarcina sp. ACRSM]
MEADMYIEKFKDDYQFRMAPRTIRSYQLAVNQLQEHLNIPFDVITSKDIRNWLMMLKEKGYKPNSVQGKLIGLKTFYKYCLEEGIIPIDPARKIPFPKIEEKLPNYLTPTQLTSLRDCVEGQLLERAVIEILFATGVRISELVDMKKADINWSERSILIPEGKWKKGRVVLFSHACGQHLQACLDSRTDSLPDVFINQEATARIRQQKIRTHFQSYSKHLGCRVTPHTMRHTFAAHLAQKGMPLESIQELLGHDHPHTTQLYARLYNQARKEMYDKWM